VVGLSDTLILLAKTVLFVLGLATISLWLVEDI
jgi:hypothetical protein